MKKIMLFTVLLILSLTYISAQTLADYTFSSTADGTLQDMTGSTALLTAATYHDDDASSVTNIGFTFTFGSSAYTQFSANSNGQMQLGATAISGGSASPTANTPRLAPLSGDNAIRATGKLHYLLTGSAPNRKLVVEWLDLRVNWSSSAETGTYCRMQAWLYEGTNNIKFVYGTMWNMSTSTQDRGVYVSTSNVVGSVGNVTNIITTMAWTNTGTSVVNTTFPASSAMANLNSSVEGSRRVFTFLPPDPLAPPNPAILASPSNGGWALTNATLNWYSGGGMPTSYDIYFGTSATPPFVANVGATTYAPTLAAGTTYYWKIVAKNANGDAAPTATWSFKTPTTTQVADSFEGTTFPPAGWSAGTWSSSTYYAKHGTKSAYVYGSTSSYYTMSTPKVTITGTSNLNLWTLSSSTTGIVQVVYSADRVTWTQVGANIAHAATYTWYNTIVDLSSLAGNNYYIGIRNGQIAASYYVDMVFGPEITPEAPGAPVLSTPADLATGVNEYPTLTWTAPTTGGVPTGYKVYLDTNTTPTTLVGTVTGLTWTPTTPLAYNTAYYWTVKAYNGAGDSTAPAPRSFTTWADPTISAFPYTESFDGATFAPTGWTNVKTAGSGTPGIWDRQTAGTSPACAPFSGAGMARYNCYSLSGGTIGQLITPPLNIPNGEAYRVKFAMFRDDGYATYNNEKINVYVNDTPGTTGATLLGSISRYYNFAPVVTTANAWYEYAFTFTGSTARKYVTFEAVSQFGNNIFIDHVIIEQVPAAPAFSYAPNAINFGTVMNAVQVGPQNVTVTNTGGGTLNLTAADLALSGTNAAQFSFATTNLPAALGAGQSVVIPVYVTGTTEGPISATLTLTYNATPYTVALSATVLPAGIVVIGNGTADLSLPIEPYFGYTYSQSIFLQSEINTPDQRIEKVYYYWNGVAEAVDSNNWTIYMGHTALTAFDTTTSWIPLANLSTVFTGTVALPATAGWIEIPLTAPFVYNNVDNLVIAVDENAASYDGSSEFFYGTASTTNRSLSYYNDTTNPDPTAPVAGTQVLGYPNVKLSFGDIPAAPVFSVSPTSWDFLTVDVMVPATKVFTITNNGVGTLDLTSVGITTGAPFFAVTTPPASMSLGAGLSTTFTVTFDPAASIAYHGVITIVHSLGSTDVGLDGTGALIQNMMNGSKNIAIGETWNFYDSGGPSGNYLASENYTYTFYPPAGYRLIVAFNQFYTEEDYDFFKAYNGPTAGSTLLGNYHANLAPFTLNPTNAITFVFTSDSGVEYAGWFAQISLEQLPIGPTTEVILGPPGDPSLDMPAIGFLLNWTTTGGTPASYQVYMSQTESTVLEDVQFNTTETSLNPTTYTGGPTDPIVFNYGETWYWIVRAMNPDNAGGYIDAPRTFTFTIQDDPRVAVFPWTENFETHSDNSLPSGWTRTSNATGWEFGSDLSSSAFSIPSHTVYAAANDDAAGSGVDGSMDILTPPPFNFAGTYPGVPVLSFDSFFTGSYSQSAYLEITTNGTIWSPLYELTSNPAWTNVVVSLDAYDDLPFVQIRFHADDNSAWASGWAVDNVSVIYSTVDNFAPIVDHYPVIGWPYTGDPVVIYADIVDSPVLFTGISSATLNYTIDGGLPIAAPMSLVGATYQATIPAQVAGTVIAYSITAVDSSPALNSTTTPTWDFSINSPVWLQYDSGAETNNVGLASGTFGIMTGFANPYGVGKSCQISSITGGLSNAGTANVHVYTYDAITDTFTDLIPSFNFAFTAGTLQTIPLTGCVTTAQYFYVAYTDIVGPNYFKLDQTQTAYPGTHFIHFGAGISTLDLGTIEGSGFPGSWLIRAQVQPVAPVTTVTNPSGSPVITWDAVIGVASYKVYGASDPYAVDPWTLLTETTGLTYTYTGTEAMKFFKVTTVYAAPVRSAIVANTKSRNTSNIETTSPSKNVRLQTSDRK